MNEVIDILNNNGYKVQRLLSSGANGDCYFVRKHNLKSCIIKVYKDNEINKCNHEMQVYNDLHGDGLGVDWLFKCEKIELGGRCFLELETYEGCTLEEYLLNPDYNLTIEAKLTALIEACDTISKMHNSQRSYLHLDIKLSNFYISSEKLHIKPIDMGSAVRIGKAKSFDSLMNDLGYMSTDGYASKRNRQFNELRKKYRKRRLTAYNNKYLITEEQKKHLEWIGNGINEKDDIFSLICCVFHVFSGGKQLGFWAEGEIVENSTKTKIRQCLDEKGIPFYIVDDFVELFSQLIEANRDETKEVQIDTVKELIEKLEEIKNTVLEEGITAGIILKNAIKYDKQHFSHIKIDKDLLTDIEPVDE